MAVTAPADKRFRRSQVRPSRRRPQWLTRLVAAVRLLTAVGVLGGTGWYAAQAVTDAQTLRVSQIHVRGNQHLARGEVLALLALRRVLPSTVEVVIRERTPLAIGRIRGDLYLVDEEGLVIDEYGPNYAQFDLPIVDGLAATTTSGDPEVDPARAGLAMRLLRALEGQPALMKRISQIDVASAHDAVVLLDQDPALLHVGDEQFVERLQRYLELHEALHSRVADIEYVDLRFDNRVYVRPGKSAIQRTSGVRR